MVPMMITTAAVIAEAMVIAAGLTIEGISTSREEMAKASYAMTVRTSKCRIRMPLLIEQANLV
jgi:leucyl aminopeptidase